MQLISGSPCKGLCFGRDFILKQCLHALPHYEMSLVSKPLFFGEAFQWLEDSQPRGGTLAYINHNLTNTSTEYPGSPALHAYTQTNKPWLGNTTTHSRFTPFRVTVREQDVVISLSFWANPSSLYSDQRDLFSYLFHSLFFTRGRYVDMINFFSNSLVTKILTKEILNFLPFYNRLTPFKCS